MRKTYVVRLSEAERAECRRVIKTLSGSSQKVRRAQMLLKVDQGEGGPGWIDARVAEAFDARRTFCDEPESVLITRRHSARSASDNRTT